MWQDQQNATDYQCAWASIKLQKSARGERDSGKRRLKTCCSDISSCFVTWGVVVWFLTREIQTRISSSKYYCFIRFIHHTARTGHLNSQFLCTMHKKSHRMPSHIYLQTWSKNVVLPSNYTPDFLTLCLPVYSIRPTLYPVVKNRITKDINGSYTCNCSYGVKWSYNCCSWRLVV